MFVLSETITPKSNPFGENTRKKVVKKENDWTRIAYKLVLSKKGNSTHNRNSKLE
ncbi:hypothetical protein LEP1GSC125_1821 [Leptospira mayottensis 200901122]|uniref:Uncharacterized protein n=1 Tax=Leptospira mayottensis 200901122 TaxID=1193010 RepID=A0AA87MMX2_9LEPT|nr:hypothetical protein LEP1GSC125_1821 [Leptospira mayottensis 200901122]